MSRTRAWGRGTARIVLPLLFAVLLGTWLLREAGGRAAERDDAALRAGVATAVTAVSAQIRTQVSQAAVDTSASGVTIPAGAARTSAASLSSLIEARDSGSPTLDDSAGVPTVVVPVYGSARPSTTAERRLALTGYRLVPLTLQDALTLAAPDRGGLVVHGPSRAVAAAPRTTPIGARTFAVPLDLGGPSGWTLEGWLPASGTAEGTWLVLTGLLVVFVGFAATLGIDERHAQASRARQEQLERESRLVSGLAPVVQASLDLGEVIPAASSHLAQGLSLAGLSLSTPGPSGERQLFTWGETPDLAVVPGASTPAHLAAGETFALSLARGGRVLGILRVLTGRPLAATDLRALATASELLGSSLANAETFTQQQEVVERLRSVDELKTVFLATASHELRTPVAAIVGFSTLVLDQWGEGDPQQTRAYLERVLANARSLETLTEQLLDFSRLERGIKPAAAAVLDLGTTTTRVLTEQPELTLSHHLSLEIATNCLVHGSEPAVARIVTNLVGNAAKYSPPDTTITVVVTSDGVEVCLIVDDEGPGVPEADRERVFTRFYRGRGDAVAGTRGTGVGLAIVAEFAASMSGTATVQQAPSGGARFRVCFPAASHLSPVTHEGESHVRLA